MRAAPPINTSESGTRWLCGNLARSCHGHVIQSVMEEVVTKLTRVISRAIDPGDLLVSVELRNVLSRNDRTRLQPVAEVRAVSKRNLHRLC